MAFIESKLVQNGARKIQKTYDPDGRVDAMCFSIPIEGREVYFKLSARVSNCEAVLRANLSSRARPETVRKIPDQAVRTAWKIVSDWVEAQMARIELAQIEVMEAFMPYIFDGTQTYFESVKHRGYKGLLPAAKGASQ